jgi:phosphate:Na+ symporter
MIATVALVQLVGYVFLLLWGTYMVQSGIRRAFEARLRTMVGKALRNRFAAAAAGIVVTAMLQSSTATALMTSSLAADGIVELVPALAVMLGANIGTAFIVKALSFDVSWIAPLPLIFGYVAFRRGRRGKLHDLGRAGIGLGLMLIALHQLVVTIEPVRTAPVLRELLSALAHEPPLELALAALLTWAAHSSIAVMLLIAALAAAGVVTPVEAVALVLGANLGGAIPPFLETATPPSVARRLPLGNLMFRASGCALVLPFAEPVSKLVWRLSASAGGAITDFHVAFNLVLALGFVGLLDPAARLLERVLPDEKTDDASQPSYLESAGLGNPHLALTNASREALRMADLVEAMLRCLLQALTGGHSATLREIVPSRKALDQLREAVKAYLAQLATDGLDEADTRRRNHLLNFVVNLAHAGDIIEQSLAKRVERQIKRGFVLTEEDGADLKLLHARVLDNLRFATSVLMTRELRSAETLIEAKRALNAMEREIGRRHAGSLGSGSIGANMAYLAILRDLRRISSHISAIAYDVIEVADWAEACDTAARRSR